MAAFANSDVKMKKNSGVLYQYLASLTGSLGVIASGMHFGWTSPSLPILQSENSPIGPITSSQGSWLISAHGIGGVVSTVLGVYLTDYLGRKACVLISCPLYFTSWMLIAFATDMSMLMAAKTFSGFGDGVMFVAFPLYLCEIADTKVRGLLSTAVPVMIIVGYLLINVLGSQFSISTTALLASSLCVANMLTFCWMPESPYYLIMRNKLEKAKSSFAKFEHVQTDSRFDKLVEFVLKDMSSRGKFWHMFTVPSNRRACFIALMLRGIQQFCGINIVTMYAKTIFQESEGLDADLSIIVYFTVQTVSVVLSALLVDKVGRRPLLLVSTIGAGMAISIQATYLYLKDCMHYDLSSLSYLPLVTLLVYVVFFDLGLYSIPMVVFGELFTTNVKSYAMASSQLYFSIVTILTSAIFQVMKDYFGLYAPFYMFTACCAFGVFFVVFCVPETKGKSFKCIQEMLEGKCKQKT